MEERSTKGREDIAWRVMTVVLVVCRLCHPSSELYIANHLYERAGPGGSARPACRKDHRRPALRLLLTSSFRTRPLLEKHLKDKLRHAVQDLKYDLLLYDVTSTFIEGEGAGNEQMKRGYSRDQRPDCKQVCIALVVSRDGMPLGYEVFDGNRTDVTTVEDVVKFIEERHGKADRVWVMDRGMVSEPNVAFLKEDGRKYILGASRAELEALREATAG